MPGSKQRVALDRRSLEAYLMGVVRRFDDVPASVTPKRLKKRAVGLNERYFSSRFHGYDVTSAYTKSLLPRL